jgi:hypothetical protein
MFAHDVADIDFDKPFDLFSLLEIFSTSKVVYPSVLPVIVSMLQQGLKTILREQDDPDSPLAGQSTGELEAPSPLSLSATRPRSMSLEKELELRGRNCSILDLNVFTDTNTRKSAVSEAEAWGTSNSSAYSNALPGRPAQQIRGLSRVQQFF